MTDFLQTIERLIDQLILHLPSQWFVEAPFLAALLSNPNGRYVLAGIIVITGLIVSWGLFLSAQVLFGVVLGKIRSAILQNVDEQNKFPVYAEPAGFKFFKRNRTLDLAADNEGALRAIEKEMLMVRKRYADGHILQDVYVAETRRLYNVAKSLKS